MSYKILYNKYRIFLTFSCHVVIDIIGYPTSFELVFQLERILLSYQLPPLADQEFEELKILAIRQHIHPYNQEVNLGQRPYKFQINYIRNSLAIMKLAHVTT